MEQELWDIKRQRKQPDNEIDHYNMVIEDLQEVINRIDSELHEIDHATHEKRMELEAERKNHLAFLRDSIQDNETIH